MGNREERGANRIPLWEQRGNNPKNHIGYLNVETRDVFTSRGQYSSPVREIMGTAAMMRSGFTPGLTANKAHKRRLDAILHGDETGDYTVYG